VKPAFDDLEDIGFDLDSDRPIEFNNKQPATGAPAAQSKALKDDIFSKDKHRPSEDNDNGLFADFGDDFGDDDYEDDDFEDEAADNKKPKEAAAAASSKAGDEKKPG
jgi:hypothetical protein